MANVGGTKLTKEQVDSLRRRLADERAKIRRLVADPVPATPSDGEQIEFEESAQRATEATQQLGIAESERALLTEVERALDKLRSGTYGISEKTGEPIPYERLAAVPWARGGVDD